MGVLWLDKGQRIRAAGRLAGHEKMQQMGGAWNLNFGIGLASVWLAIQQIMTRKLAYPLAFGAAFCLSTALVGQDHHSAPGHRTTAEAQELINRVVANQEQNDRAMDVYERIERVEVRKTGSDPRPSSVRIARVIPAGTGTGKAPVGEDGKPANAAVYQAEMEKIVKALAWAAEEGRAQREAYEKIAKKKKERDELIESTRTAFLYTFAGSEERGGVALSKYAIEPNPAFHARTRMESVFMKVKGFVWVEDKSAQLARVEGDVTEDISVGLFLGKVYKGSHFMQERYEIAPGLWLPTFSQYDFDGRKLFSSFAVHERTFYSNYRRIGPPKEALAALRTELSKPEPVAADP
jgi:hypothetical protein